MDSTGTTGPELEAVAEADDNAAELDDTEVDPAEGFTESEVGYAAGDTETWSGTCAGGPYHGRVIDCRFPKGFLLADRGADKAWIYDFNGTAFLLRAGMPQPLQLDGRWQAAEEDQYDVLAYDSEQVPR